MRTVITTEEISVHTVAPDIFLRTRTAFLGASLLLTFSNLVLLCLVIFLQWDIMGQSQHSLIFILVIVNFITVIVLPFLLGLPFKSWLDTARIFFLLVCHYSVAGFFTKRAPLFPCYLLQDGPESCRVTTSLIAVVAWTIPVILTVYAGGLAYFIIRSSRADSIPVAETPETQKDVEKGLQSPHRDDDMLPPPSATRSFFSKVGTAY